MNVIKASSNSPPQNTLVKDSEPCLICGAPTLERHFQVITCNACAAFFRRSIKIRSSYRCQRNQGMCNLSIRKVGRPLCRYCRLKKCFEVGMKSEFDENIKMPKSEYSTTSQRDLVTEEKINTCPKEYRTNTFIQKCPAMNVEKVYQEVKLILEQEPKCFTAMDNFNITKKFVEALSKFCKKPKELTLLSANIDHSKRMEYYENYLVDVSKLLINIEYFSALSFSEKFALYKRFWQKFQILEKCYLTFLCFGKNQEDMRYIVGQDHFIDIDSKQLELQQTRNETALFLFPVFDKTRLLIKHIKKTSITIFEFSYICQILLWSCAEIEEITPQTCKLAEEMIQKASDELHDYYVNDMHMLNYAARQAELIKHVRLTEFVFRDKRQLMAANQIFNFIENNLRLNILT